LSFSPPDFGENESEPPVSRLAPVEAEAAEIEGKIEARDKPAFTQGRKEDVFHELRE
jgi:hypothetical protein